MYNLFEYGDSYSLPSGRLSNYHRDDIDDFDDNRLHDQLFKYKTDITGKTTDQPLQLGNPDDACQYHNH